MECVGGMSEGDWNCFSGMYSTEEAEFMAQLVGICSLPNELPSNNNFGFSYTCWPGYDSDVNMAGTDQGPKYSSDDTSANVQSFSQGSSYSGDSIFFHASSTHQHRCNPSDSYPIFMVNDDGSLSMDYVMVEGQTTGSSDQMYSNNQMITTDGDINEFLNQEVSNDSIKLPEAVPEESNLRLRKEDEMPVPELSLEDKADNLSEKSKKRSRIREHVQNNKRIIKPKKKQKLDCTDHNNDESNHLDLPHQQSSSSCLSENDSNVSEEFQCRVAAISNSKGAKALSLNGKTRASRGTATDPQTLYARKRRERINERLRTLQNIVPNGTKVDISTMLEEAVQYVKFLQLQIKLLSSDDLWMYAPIAYNGMNIGLDLKIVNPTS